MEKISFTRLFCTLITKDISKQQQTILAISPPFYTASISCRLYLCIQLHYMGHLIPAKAHKTLVVLWTVPSYHNIGFKVRLPLHLIGCGGCPPFGVVGRSMALGPDMIPRDMEKWNIMTNKPNLMRRIKKSRAGL